MQSECERHGIRFVRIKPPKSWEELYYTKYNRTGRIHGFPTMWARWCNSEYKLAAKKQLQEFMKKQGFYTVFYIGYCADEEKRWAKRVDLQKVERYPLVEENIEESTIWAWAKTQPIFNHYYETQKRCGCMYCPMSHFITFAYLYKYYPDNFDYMIDKMRETEIIREKELGIPSSCISSNPKYNADYLEKIIKTKWLKKLEELERKCL